MRSILKATSSKQEGRKCPSCSIAENEAACFSAGRLLSTFYRDAESLQAILTCVNTLAISKRNKRCKDVLYGIVTRNTHEFSTSFKQIISG
jgi:hypothetical protein